MQPRGMRGSETNLPNLPQHLPAQPRLSLKGHGMDPPNTAPPPSPRHRCQCTSSPPSWCHSGGPLIAGGPIAVGPPVPSSCCVRSRGCLHGNGVRSVVRVAMYTWTAVGLPQIKMMMKYLAGPGVHWGSPIPGQAWGPHLQGLKGEVPDSGCRG